MSNIKTITKHLSARSKLLVIWLAARHVDAVDAKANEMRELVDLGIVTIDARGEDHFNHPVRFRVAPHLKYVAQALIRERNKLHGPPCTATKAEALVALHQNGGMKMMEFCSPIIRNMAKRGALVIEEQGQTHRVYLTELGTTWAKQYLRLRALQRAEEKVLLCEPRRTNAARYSTRPPQTFLINDIRV